MRKYLSLVCTLLMLSMCISCGKRTEDSKNSSDHESKQTTISEKDKIETETATETTTQPPTTTLVVTTPVEALNDYEKYVFDFLVSYSTNMVSPSSLRLSSWVSGIVNDDKSFHGAGMKTGDKLEGGGIIGQNQMGGNTLSYVFIKDNVIYGINPNTKDIYINDSFASAPSLLKNPDVMSQDSINHINVALKDYFSSIGY